MIKYLRDRHASDPRTALAYFFFSFSDLERQKVEGMLASILKQIYARRPDTPEAVQSLKDYKARGERPDTETLETAVLATAHGFSDTFIVIDALDECPSILGERKKLLASLRRIIAAMPPNVHIFCTSRAEPDIVSVMQSILSPMQRAQIDLTSHRSQLYDDIGLYIDNTLASDAYASWPRDLKDEAKESLIGNADGMQVTKPSLTKHFVHLSLMITTGFSTSFASLTPSRTFPPFPSSATSLNACLWDLMRRMRGCS